MAIARLARVGVCALLLAAATVSAQAEVSAPPGASSAPSVPTGDPLCALAFQLVAMELGAAESTVASDSSPLADPARLDIAIRACAGLADWVAKARATGIGKHKGLVDHLKSAEGLTHGYANSVALRTFGTDAGAIGEEALMAAMFAGPKAAGSWIGFQNAFGNSFSGILGPILAGVIVARAGYDGAFYVAAAVAILGGIWWIFAIPRIEQVELQ